MAINLPARQAWPNRARRSGWRADNWLVRLCLGGDLTGRDCPKRNFNIRTRTLLYDPSLDVNWTLALKIEELWGLHFFGPGIRVVQYTNRRRPQIAPNC